MITAEMLARLADTPLSLVKQGKVMRARLIVERCLEELRDIRGIRFADWRWTPTP